MSDVDALIGKTIGNYQITRLLGEGGMGSVYLAENPKIESKVAIKILHPVHGMDPAIVKRFIGEARAVNRVGHPGIVRIHDFGEEEGVGTYLAMEFLEGKVLREELKARGKLPGVEVANILSQAAATLGEVHKKGIIHRDMKPENMFLVPDLALPRGVRVMILDFGIAKLTEDSQNMGSSTMTGVVFGSPNYMSHEQCCDTKSVDHRTDIYSLGVIGYELLTGHIPYKAESLGDLVRKQLTEAPEPPSHSNPDCTSAMDAVVLKALSVEPGKRFGSMDDLVTAIHLALDGVPPGALEDDDEVDVDVKGSGSQTVAMVSKPQVKISEIATVPPKPRKETTRGVGAVGSAQPGVETRVAPPEDGDVQDTAHAMAATRSPVSRLLPVAVVVVLLAAGAWGVGRFAAEQGEPEPAAGRATTEPATASVSGQSAASSPTPSSAPAAAPAVDSGASAVKAPRVKQRPKAGRRARTAKKSRGPRRSPSPAAAPVEAAAPEVKPAKKAKPVEQPFRSLGAGPKKKTTPDEERPFDSLGPPAKKKDKATP